MRLRKSMQAVRERNHHLSESTLRWAAGEGDALFRAPVVVGGHRQDGPPRRLRRKLRQGNSGTCKNNSHDAIRARIAVGGRVERLAMALCEQQLLSALSA